jgi:putative colanic acid biosynthesis glycosyltransferase
MIFSIITITRNNRTGLARTRTSLINQTCRDFEWIVIDGASTDGTTDDLRTVPPDHWISEPDNGIYDAMNKGLACARGDYLLFLNAGDSLAAPDVLEKLSPLSADFLYGDALEGGHYKRARPHTRILTGMITHHQSMLYRRAALGDLRYDTTYHIAADYKFTLAFLQKPGITAAYAPFALCDFDPGGLSQTAARLGRMEQSHARRDLNACNPLTNLAIIAAQTVLMALRRTVPGLYWLLKQIRL